MDVCGLQLGVTGRAYYTTLSSSLNQCQKAASAEECSTAEL